MGRPDQLMKLIALALGVGGLLMTWSGYATFSSYQTYTETSVGVVDRHQGSDAIVRFHREFESSEGDKKIRGFTTSEVAFKLDEARDKLAVGAKVTAYHPPDKLYDARLDKDFSNAQPFGQMVLGVVLMVASGAILYLALRKQRMPSRFPSEVPLVPPPVPPSPVPPAPDGASGTQPR